MINEIMVVFKNLDVVHILGKDINEFVMGKDARFKWRLKIRNGGSIMYEPFKVLPPTRIFETFKHESIDHIVVWDECPYQIDTYESHQKVSLTRNGDMTVILKGGENNEAE